MQDEKLKFDRSCHVLYSKDCKKQIQDKIALHYPPEKRAEVWMQVQQKYVEFLQGWRTDLGGEKNFHNGTGGTYDCIALMTYYVVCRPVTGMIMQRNTRNIRMNRGIGGIGKCRIEL